MISQKAEAGILGLMAGRTDDFPGFTTALVATSHCNMLARSHSRYPVCACRVANVVAWLESLAADELSRQGAPRFADHDGVWIETRQQAGGELEQLTHMEV